MRTPQRAKVVIDLIKQHGYKRIAEVGVCKGEMAMPILEACDLDYYALIDPALNDSLGLYNFIANYPEAKLFEMTSKEAAVYFSDVVEQLDLVIVDAIHTEESVDEDIHLWTPKVRVGGIICGHDYDNRRFPGVKIAVDRFYGEGRVRTEPVRMCKMWIVKLLGPLEKEHLIS